MKPQSQTPAPESANPAPGSVAASAGETRVSAPVAENGPSSEPDLNVSILEAIEGRRTAAEEAPQAPDAVQAPAEESQADVDGPAAEEPEAGTTNESQETEDDVEEPEAGHAVPEWVRKKFARDKRKREALQAQLEGAGLLREERDALKAKLAELETQNKPEESAETPVPVGLSASEAKLQREIDTKADYVATLDEALAQAEREGAEYATLREGDKEAKFSLRQARLMRARFAAEQSAAVFRMEQSRTQLAQEMDAMYRAAVTEHPWLKDATHADTQRIQTVLREFPWLKSMRGVVRVLADAMAYQKVKAAQSAPAAPAASKPPPPRQPGKPSSAPPARPSPQGQTVNRHAKYVESGKNEDLLDVLPDLVERRS